MLPANLGGWTGLILLLVVILLFAAPKLPQLARSLGQSMTIFKKEIKNKDVDGETTPESSTSTPTASAPASSAPVQSTSTAEGTDSPSTK